MFLLMIFNKEEKKYSDFFFLMKSEDVEGFMPNLVYWKIKCQTNFDLSSSMFFESPNLAYVMPGKTI